ncbi:MAG: ABC transporter ATP-binding protein [Prochlorothrix sp.]
MTALSSSPAILSLEGVVKHFPTAPIPAVNQVNLNLKPGELLGLLGPSGCGKTTLLRLIAGFDQLQSGRILIGNQEIACPHCTLPPERRGIGMVFQDYALFPHLTVVQNIGFGLRQQRGWPRSTVQQRIAEVIALASLDGLQQRYPHELSGGQQQRVALARALAPNPSLILLDEPLSNLDVQVRLRLRQELRTILKAAGTSAILVTHDQEEALSVCDRVAVMRQGKVEQVATPQELYTDPATRFVAEFVTQANFVPAQRLDQVWETELGCCARSAMETKNPIEADRVDLMIRQEDLQLEPDPQGVAVVRDRQFLGREQRYSVVTPSGRELVARVSLEQRLDLGSRVAVTFNPQQVRIFDRGDRRLTVQSDLRPTLTNDKNLNFSRCLPQR